MSEFSLNLCDLNNHKRATIKHFTNMAETNKENAELVVRAIQKHIIKSNPEVKLSAMYLINSIIKNVEGNYVDLFSHEIDIIFSEVFKESDVNTRKILYSMRQTWNTIFSAITLLTLDTKIKELDPALPITDTVALAKPDNLNSHKRQLELQLAATEHSLAHLDQQSQNKRTNLENETTLLASPEEPSSQEPDLKKIKLDWMDKVFASPKEFSSQETDPTENKTDSMKSKFNSNVLNNKNNEVVEIMDDDSDDDETVYTSDDAKDSAISRAHRKASPINNSAIDAGKLLENSTSTQRAESTGLEVTTIDGNVHFIQPISVKKRNNIKISIKSDKSFRIITDAERAARNQIASVDKEKEVIKIKKEPDEFSGLCTIM